MRSAISRYWILIGIFLLVVQALVLYFFGQPWICECGYVKAWEGAVRSAGNSQHLSDWYTFSHVIHGFAFYAVLWYFFPRLSFVQRFLLALAAEISWEIVENTPWLIEHYRAQALAQGYVGDSILNSISDTLAMALGFLLAWRLPVFATIALAISFELFVGYSIRDNLVLNSIGLFHQFDFISRWQGG